MSPLTEPTKLTLAKGQPVPNDPYFAFNSLLLHGNGTNGSTVITDSSGSPKTVTPVGNAQISTAVADPFGNSTRGVLAFDGNGDYLSIGSDAGFAFPDTATIEAWIRVSSIASVQYIYGQSSSSSGLIIYIGAGGVVGVQSGTGYRETSAIVSANTWHFLSITKSSSTYTTWLNGIQQSYVSSAGTMLASIPQLALNIGANSTGASGLNGYIDELRITKGVARYTANFTPPTAPFPDF